MFPMPRADQHPASTPSREDAVRCVSFVSLGCPKNLVDSEKMLGTLVESGFELVDSDRDADAIIINTCGFLEASREESLEVIHEAIERKNRGELKRVVVAGCLVQRHRAKMLEWAPGIDAMIGVFDRDHVIDAVAGAPSRDEVAGDAGQLPRYWIAANALQAAGDRGMKTVGLTVNGADGKGIGYFEDDSSRFRLTPRHWAYLRVSEGCNQNCAFCTIPSIRGKMRSKPLDRIIAEARQLMADGAFELNLIGQDTTSYGYDIYGRDRGIDPSSRRTAAGRTPRIDSELPSTGDLVGLLTALNDVAAERGGGWMRLMYVYPTHFTDEMIDAIASLPHITKYIDIPLQHISDRMLKAMRRNISRTEQEALLYKLRERIPGLAIRTTFITGFPGETEEDHEELLEFIDEFGFDMLGVFQYSREHGTPAARMDRDATLHVPDRIKAAREAEIMTLQQEIAFDNAKYVALERCQFDVLIDAKASEPGPSSDPRSSVGGSRYVGRCYHQAPQVDSVTYVESDNPLSPGELVRCTIVDSEGYDLIARPTAELERKVNLPIIS
jgi:ribosomal protein S12 methylthiotransferase